MEKYGSTNDDLVAGLQTELMNAQQQLAELHKDISETVGSVKTATIRKTMENLTRRATAIKEKIAQLKST